MKLLIGRTVRISTGILLPPLLGGFVLALLPLLFCVFDLDPSSCQFVPAIFVSAYLVMIVPSIIYSVLIEFFFNPIVESRILYLSGNIVLGAIAGSLVGLSPLLPIGAVVGLIVGLILRANYDKDVANK